MELQIASKKSYDTAPVSFGVDVTEQKSKVDRDEVRMLLKKNREVFDRHVARLTKLQQLIVAEESMIADCLAKEKLLLTALE